MCIVDPNNVLLGNNLSLEINWEIAPNQEYFPLLPRYWLQKIPLIMAHIGGQVETNDGRSGSFWKVFAPLFRACVGDWRNWLHHSGLAIDVFVCLIKLRFLLPEQAQCEVARVMSRFCEETVQTDSDVDCKIVSQICSYDWLQRTWLYIIIRCPWLTVLLWSSGLALVLLATIFECYLNCSNIAIKLYMVSLVEEDHKTNCCSKQYRVSTRPYLEKVINSITQAYTDREARVRLGQGEVKKIPSRKCRVGKQKDDSLWLPPDASSRFVRRISQYLVDQSVELTTKCDKLSKVFQTRP